MGDDFYTNTGPLLSPERLADIAKTSEWQCDDAAAQALRAIRDAYEKHDELLIANVTEPQTMFFSVNPVIHALGYVYSIDEDLPLQGEGRTSVDYTLFADGEDFLESDPMRGSTSFFRNSICLVQSTSWDEDLDISDDIETAAQQPMVMMDVLLRSSGVDYGVATNGSTFRLIHRGSSETLSVFFEVKLHQLAKATLEEFKTFYLIFSKASHQRNDEGVCFVDQYLA